MSQVFTDCPNTGKPIYVGLNLEWAQLESLDLIGVDQDIPRCPHCGQEHRFEKQDLYLRTDGAG
ncbi:MAG: hypothetical protein MJE12_10770 [Alphaproteobacteria bacterium]|nr:hypothetical protein [Alphaproteobacteria bacterium]